MTSCPRILIFDSGLGGLTVFAPVAEARPDAELIYVADDALFPYGDLSERALVERVVGLMSDLMAELTPDLVVIACNTASTLVLPILRERWPDIPFVGTVPAIKPAAETSKSRMISILATPGTAARDYTRDLIEKFAVHCDVTLVGSQKLATLAEDFMHGALPPNEAISLEIAPCFIERDGRRTDSIVLACTHYPLLLDAFERLAPWPVRWINPAPAIARRADHVISERFPKNAAREGKIAFRFTSGAAPDARLLQALDGFRAAPTDSLSPQRGVR
jgi:glutamate racemase